MEVGGTGCPHEGAGRGVCAAGRIYIALLLHVFTAKWKANNVGGREVTVLLKTLLCFSLASFSHTRHFFNHFNGLFIYSEQLNVIEEYATVMTRE